MARGCRSLYNKRMQQVSIIAAMGRNRGLGFGNKLPWHLPDDLKRFKEFTRGHAVIMGRRTFESIGRPLPDRKNIIVSRDGGYAAPGCEVVASIEEAFKAADGDTAGGDGEVFVIGGAQIYALALPYAAKMYLTFVDAEVPADAFFPAFDEAAWTVTASESHAADGKHPYPFVFKVFERSKN